MSKKKNTTGIIRRVDDLGRVVVPKEIRRVLGINEGDPVEIGLEGELIYMQKPSFGCKFCSKKLTESELESKFKICSSCKEEIASL
ncbi:MAG: AbrB/MazE/SpoVT family DNA-binding domain-containing protein [Clostridium sp.]|nr:AbrB/MazE/SpoVT family DNA-binding domain-containing protein [Clostridium sp.]